MILLLKGLVLCFLLLLVCVIGIRNGAVGLVCFYEKDVQERVVSLGLVTERQVKRQYLFSAIAMFVPLFTLVPYMVYGINGATSFWDGFVQITVILLIMGLFDRLFIDWYWVGKTKAWLIPGTEDLMPYIPKKVLVRKWVRTLIGYPLIALLIAGVMCLFI